MCRATVSALVWTCTQGCLCWVVVLEETRGSDCSVLFLDHLCKSQIGPETLAKSHCDFSWEWVKITLGRPGSCVCGLRPPPSPAQISELPGLPCFVPSSVPDREHTVKGLWPMVTQACESKTLYPQGRGMEGQGAQVLSQDLDDNCSQNCPLISLSPGQLQLPQASR